MKKALISLFVLAVLAVAGFYAQQTGWVTSIYSTVTGNIAANQP
jgi:hypothetical protein